MPGAPRGRAQGPQRRYCQFLSSAAVPFCSISTQLAVQKCPGAEPLASYPITIDPVVATLEKILIAGGASSLAGPQFGAQFGDAVAIDSDLAIVGAWLDDFAAVDNGLVYYFSRTGSTWTLLDYSFGSAQAGAKCGYSVAISGDQVVFGCPGANTNAGITMVESLSLHRGVELKPGSDRHRFPAEIISHCVWLYFRFALSFRDVEEMLAMRGVALTYETVREWRLKVRSDLREQLATQSPSPRRPMAPRRSVPQDQRPHPLPLACGRSGR